MKRFTKPFIDKLTKHIVIETGHSEQIVRDVLVSAENGIFATVFNTVPASKTEQLEETDDNDYNVIYDYEDELFVYIKSKENGNDLLGLGHMVTDHQDIPTTSSFIFVIKAVIDSSPVNWRYIKSNATAKFRVLRNNVKLDVYEYLLARRSVADAMLFHKELEKLFPNHKLSKSC